MAVEKINGFAAPYRSKTFRGETDSLVGRNGVLAMADEVFESGGNVIIPPFQVVQEGLVYKKTNPTTIIKPVALTPPFYITVSAPTPIQTDDLVFQFARSPLDISPNEVILAEYDGFEWRQLPRVSIDGILEDKAQEVIEKGQVGPYSGLLTSIVGSNYVNSPGLLFDKTGMKIRFDSAFSTPIIASDPELTWRRVDRMIYRRPVDSENRIGVRELVLGGSFAPTGPKIIHQTNLNAGSVPTNITRSTIASDNTAHVFYTEGYGDAFQLKYKKVSTDRSSIVTSATLISTMTSPYFDVAIDSANRSYVVYQSNNDINMAVYDVNGSLVVGPLVVESLSSPCSNPTVRIDPLNTKLFIAFEYLQGPGNKQTYFCTRDFSGGIITPSLRINNTLTNIINPSIDVSSDLCVHMVYEEAGVIKYIVLDDIGGVVTVEQIVSANVGSTSFGTRVNNATRPTVKVSENKEIFILFRQKKNLTDYGLSIWHNGSAFMPNIITSGESFNTYSVNLDSFNNDLQLSLGQAGSLHLAIVRDNISSLVEVIETAGVNDCHVVKDKFGALFHTWASAIPGTYTNLGAPETPENIGAIAIPGSLNTLMLTDHQISFPAGISTVPAPGMMMVLSGSGAGNNAIYLIMGITLESIDSLNDTYVVTVQTPFANFESPATGVSTQFQTPDGSIGKFAKSVAEKDEIRALTTDTMPSDILLARISWPGPIILNYIPQSGIGVNSDLFGMYGDIDVDWGFTAPNSLTMTNGLGIVDLLTATVYTASGGTFFMNEGDALYVKLDGVNTNITPIVAPITSLPWALPIQVLGFRKNGEFHPHLFSVAGMHQLDIGEQIELGEDLSKTVRIRLGITNDVTMAPYTSTVIIAPSDPYQTAISKLDGALAAFSMDTPQEEDFLVGPGGQSVFVKTAMDDWSPLNTELDIAVYVNGIKQKQDVTGGLTKDYRKNDEEEIEFATPIPELSVVTIRKERAGAPPIGGGTDLTNIAVDPQPVANASNSIGTVSKAWRSVFLKDTLSSQVYELKVVGGTLQAVLVP